jgi:hypothetical protein
MKPTYRNCAIATALLASITILPGCGGPSVQGKTYQSDGGVVQIEFDSGGKAKLTTLNSPTDCTWTEDGKAVNVTCAGQPAAFTMNDDGTLSAGEGNQFGKLTEKK